MLYILPPVRGMRKSGCGYFAETFSFAKNKRNKDIRNWGRNICRFTPIPRPFTLLSTLMAGDRVLLKCSLYSPSIYVYKHTCISFCGDYIYAFLVNLSLDVQNFKSQSINCLIYIFFYNCTYSSTHMNVTKTACGSSQFLLREQLLVKQKL